MARRSSLWFKCDPEEMTVLARELRVKNRSIFYECYFQICKTEVPLPDKPKTMAYLVGCSVQEWLAARTEMIAAGLMTPTADGLMIQQAMDVVRERSERCASRAKRQLSLTSEGPLVDLSTSSEEPVRDLQTELPCENNNPTSQNATQTKNHHHQTQNSEREKDSDPSAMPREAQASEEGTGKAFCDSDFSIDDDDRSARPLPPSLVRATEVACGSEERAAEIISEYLASAYGRNRRHDGAFVKWAGKTYGIQISTRGSTFGPRQLAELCGTDTFGRPESSLSGTREALAKRRGTTLPAPAAH